MGGFAATSLPLMLVVRTGSQPVLQGRPTDGLWTVDRGVVLGEWVGPDGRRLAQLIGPGEAVGEPDGRPAATSCRALRPCRLRAPLPHEVPHLLSARARAASDLAFELAWLRVRDRVERRLVDAATRFGRRVPGGTAIGIPLTQEDLASLAGTSRESVTRAVRWLVAQGRLQTPRRARFVVPMLHAVPAGDSHSELWEDPPSWSRIRLHEAQ
jgi:CRP/FNR family transcriptional regulator, cyclic AMP receptor protein